MPQDLSISFELIFLLHSDCPLIKIHCYYILYLHPCVVTVSDQDTILFGLPGQQSHQNCLVYVNSIHDPRVGFNPSTAQAHRI